MNVLENRADQYLTVNQCSIRYREAGSGPVLLLVHGIAGYLEEWDPAMEILQHHFRVIALDLPGHGLSGKPVMAYTIDSMAGFLKSFLSAMKLEKVFLAGHSLGGAISLYFTIQHPHLVERLILVNSAFTKIPLSIRLGSFRFLPRLFRKIPFVFVKASARCTFYHRKQIPGRWLADSFRYINQPGALRVMFSIIRSNMTLTGLKKELSDVLLKKIDEMSVPALILYGEKDRIVPNINSKLLHQSLQGSECVSFKNCGHELQVECCDLFCRQTEDFLRIPR